MTSFPSQRTNIKVSQIADLMYEEDPFFTSCKDSLNDCEYINEADYIKQHIDSGFSVYDSVTKAFMEYYLKPPKIGSKMRLVYQIQTLLYTAA